MVQPTKSPLAWAHQFPPPLPAGLDMDRTILIRYDGVKAEGGDVIFAVLGADQMRLLPERVTEGLEFSRRDAEGEIRGSPDAFFIGSERHLSLYVNVDAYPDFIERVRDLAFEQGLDVAIGEGDLQSMTGPDGDISAPKVPAFVENGLGYVPSVLAMSYLSKIRPVPDAHPGPDLG